MKRKIERIYIDGMENSGGSSVASQTRQNLESKCQLKENGILSVFYKELKQFHGVKYIHENYGELIRKEVADNNQNGVVHFFLMPEDAITARNLFEFFKVPDYYDSLMVFYKGINQTSLSQGLDIRLITFNEFDRIYDIRDKILKILEEEYEI